MITETTILRSCEEVEEVPSGSSAKVYSSTGIDNQAFSHNNDDLDVYPSDERMEIFVEENPPCQTNHPVAAAAKTASNDTISGSNQGKQIIHLQQSSTASAKVNAGGYPYNATFDITTKTLTLSQDGTGTGFEVKAFESPLLPPSIKKKKLSELQVSVSHNAETPPVAIAAPPKKKSPEKKNNKLQTQTLKQTQFEVPINQKWSRKGSKEPNQPLEAIFGGKVKRVKGGGTMSPLREDLNLTAEQLFQVYEQQESPRKVVEREMIGKLLEKKLQSDLMNSADNLLDPAGEAQQPHRKHRHIDVNLAMPRKQLSFAKHSTLTKPADLINWIGQDSPDHRKERRDSSYYEEAYSPGTLKCSSPRILGFGAATRKMTSQHSMSMVSSPKVGDSANPTQMQGFQPMYAHDDNSKLKKPKTAGLNNPRKNKKTKGGATAPNTKRELSTYVQDEKLSSRNFNDSLLKKQQTMRENNQVEIGGAALANSSSFATNLTGSRVVAEGSIFINNQKLTDSQKTSGEKKKVHLEDFNSTMKDYNSIDYEEIIDLRASIDSEDTPNKKEVNIAKGHIQMMNGVQQKGRNNGTRFTTLETRESWAFNNQAKTLLDESTLNPPLAMQISPRRTFQQKIPPRTSKAKSGLYLQVSPRIFNQQMITKKKVDTKADSQPNQVGRKQKENTCLRKTSNSCAPAVQSKSKREMMQKMAGVHSYGGAQQPQQNFESDLVIDTSPSGREKKAALLLKEYNNAKKMLSVIKEQSVSAGPSLDKTIGSFDESIVRSNASQLSSGPSPLHMIEIHEGNMIDHGVMDPIAADTTRSKIHQMIVAVQKQTEEVQECVSGGSHLIQDTRNHGDSMVGNQTTHNGESIVREISELAKNHNKFDLEDQIGGNTLDQVFKQFSSAGSSPRQVANNSQQRVKRFGKQQVLSRVSPNKMSVSIHQSSQLDGESSYQTARLTPMELKLPMSQHMNRGVAKKPPGTANQTATPRNQFIPRLYPMRVGVDQKPSEKASSNNVTSALTIKIQTRREGARDSSGENRYSKNNGSRTPKFDDKERSAGSQKRSESTLKQKAFLRQVYSNMQNNNSNRQSKLYDRLSRGLKNELENSYARRTRQDNEWQFRVMRSKLGIFEKCQEEDQNDVSQGDGPSIAAQSNEFDLSLNSGNNRTDMATNGDRTKKRTINQDFDKSYSMSFQQKEASVVAKVQAAQAIATQTSDKNQQQSPVAAITTESIFNQEVSNVVSPQSSDAGCMADFSTVLPPTLPNQTIVSQISFRPLMTSPGGSTFRLSRGSCVASKRLGLDSQQSAMGLRSSAEKVKDIVKSSPGSNAYLEHVQQRIQLHSQGGRCSARKLALVKNIQKSSTFVSGETNMVKPLDAHTHEGFHTARTFIKTGDCNRREVLSLDYATTQAHQRQRGEAQQFNKTEHSRAMSPQNRQIVSMISPRTTGYRTTRNSVYNDGKVVATTTKTPKKAGSHPASDAQLKQLQQLSQTQSSINRMQTIELTSKLNNFAISRAKPTLFQPLNLNTGKVDSFVTACQVANKITRPGEPYQTTESLSQLKQSLSKQRRTSLIQRYIYQQHHSVGGGERIAQDQFECQSTKSQFQQALNLNKQIGEQNRQLRNRAFSFTKRVNKKDIGQIAKNLDSLNQTTREKFTLSPDQTSRLTQQ